MADDLEQLSDAQIRDQLKSLGVSTGPVTPTTRPILLKKLRSLKSGQGTITAAKAKQRRSIATSSPAQGRTKLSGFSSDEEEFPIKKSASLDSPASASRRRSAFPRLRQVKNEESDDKNESSVDDKVAFSKRPVARRSLPRSYVRETKSFDTLPGGAKNGPTIIDDEEVERIVRERPSHRKYSFELEEDDTEGVIRRIIDDKKSQKVDKRSEKIPGEIKSDLSKVTTRRRRAAQSLADTGKDTTNEVDQDNEQEDEELELTFASNSSFFRSWRGPAFIIAIVILLVCLVGSYMSLWSNRRSEFPTLPDSSAGQSSAGSSSAGVKRDHVFQVLQCLHEKLSTSAGEKECGYPSVKISMNGKDLSTFAAQCKSAYMNDLVNYEKLAVKVANLAIDEKYSDFFSVQDDRDDISKPVTEKTLSSISLSSKRVIKPFGCRINQAALMLSKYLLGILLALGILFGIYYLLKRRWMLDDEDTRLMFVFVEKIIETLRRHHDACQHDKELPAYLPIPHVRDMLIPPRERRQKEKAWRKAVDFLGSTDSRIRVETQRIAGEDYEVWRWIGVMTSDIKIRGASNHLGPEDEKGKFWQGPAFDKLEKVVRLPILTPTPCLKIRYLHGGPAEKEDGWDLQVRDALLEKCNQDGAKILHVFVDAKSVEGCVYVKCDSLESAGKAFRSIYGNWFDGRLVIVKFVTVARYNQRFPDALSCTQSLEVSGKFPSSLSWNNPEVKPPVVSKK